MHFLPNKSEVNTEIRRPKAEIRLRVQCETQDLTDPYHLHAARAMRAAEQQETQLLNDIAVSTNLKIKLLDTLRR